MNAIIWKELRENLKWAILWMLGIGAAMAYTLSQPDDYWWAGDDSLSGRSFLFVTMLGAAVGGALLGILQIVPELRRDQWAFLIHRPASATSIFAGKVIAGLALLLASMGIPLLFAGAWASTPGSIAGPFDWRMALGGLADILTGFVFYFAGILTGVRQVRWYGSRGLSIFAAIPCIFLVHIVPEFWHALAIIAVFTAMGATAAWGAFVAGGEYGSQPRAAKFSLASSIFAGIVVVGMVGTTFFGSLVFRSATTTWSQYAIDKDGLFLRIKSDFGQVIEVTDPARNPVEKYGDAKSRENVNRNTLQRGSLLDDWKGFTTGYRSAGRYFLHIYSYSTSKLAWYYDHRSGRILAYSRKPRRLVGSLGPEGFASAGQAHTERFVGQLQWFQSGYSTMLAFPKAAYRLDLAEKTVSSVFSTDEDEIRGVCDLTSGLAPTQSDTKEPATVFVATRSQLHIVPADGAPRVRAPFHHKLHPGSSVSVSMLPDRSKYYVWYYPSYQRPAVVTNKTPIYVVEIARDGTELARHELPSLSGDQIFAGRSSAWGIALLPFAVAVAGASYTVGRFLLFDGEDPIRFFDWLQAELPGPAWVSAVGAIVLLLSASVCAWLSYRTARRYAFSNTRRRWWAALAFLLGPAGLLTMHALYDWPAREKCPACGLRRVVDRDRCEHCEAAFAPPARDGTEIFDEPVAT